MELYGTKLHILGSITGGFMLHRNDKWPNIIKIIVFLIFFAAFYLLLSFELPNTAIFLISTLIAIVVLIIELIMIWFNSLLDDSLNTHEDFEEIESIIPAGISGPLWESRHLLFDERMQMDDRVYQLVRKGFDIDEIFRLVTLIQNGAVTRDMQDRAPVRKVKTNLILLCGRPVNVHFDRDSLQRTFARPVNNWHLLSAFILSVMLPIGITISRSLIPKYLTWLAALLATSAIFSLLLPPQCDPYSTSFTDPYISYSRAAVAVSMVGSSCLLLLLQPYVPEYYSFMGYLFNIPSLMNLAAKIFYLCFLMYPVGFMIGIFGHPVTTIHWLIESLNKYLFGISGSTNIKKSFGAFMSSLVMVVIVDLVLTFKNPPITVCLSMFFVTFFTQFSIADNCQTFMKRHLVSALISACLSGATAFSNWLINEKAIHFVLICIILCHAVIDLIFPYVTTHQQYVIFHGRILSYAFLTKYAHYITNFVTGPAYISISLIKYPIEPYIASTIILHGLRISQTLPHIFCVSLIISYFLLFRETGFKSLSTDLFVSLMLSRKLIKVMRYLRVWFKARYVPAKIYTDPFLDKWEYFKSAVLTTVISFIPHPLSIVSGPALGWSLITGAPLSISFGYIGLFFFSPPRPNSFYDFVNGDVPHDEYIKSSSDYPLEAPTYLSLSEALQKDFGNMVKDGRLGLVNDDSFFLMMSDDLMAIVHVIALEANKVSFQVRGLEYISQTLCHGGELSVLQQIVLEHQNFGNIGQCFAFKHSMFELRAMRIPLTMISFSKCSLVENVIPRLGKSFLMWELRSLVFFALSFMKKENQFTSEEIAAMNEKLRGVKPGFSERNMEYVRYVASHLDLQLDERTLKRLWVVTHFVHSVVVSRNGGFKYDKILDVFDGREELHDEIKDNTDVILYAFRYSIAILFLVSVGLEPENSTNQSIVQFMEETEESYKALPLRSPELEQALQQYDRPVITLVLNEEVIEVVRFAKSDTNWAVFSLEPECIRGFWANEARSILFFALSSRERHSIQASVPTLRNITNQSCNSPVGYPAYVTNIIYSYSDKEFSNNTNNRNTTANH